MKRAETLIDSIYGLDEYEIQTANLHNTESPLFKKWVAITNGIEAELFVHVTNLPNPFGCFAGRYRPKGFFKTFMKTSYFTFGQSHIHSINGVIFDKDIVLKITAEDPRNVMFNTFGRKWAMEYDEPPKMELFKRGIFEFDTL